MSRDWEEIKALYVEGEAGADGEHHWPTLDEVAGRFGLSGTSVRNRSAAEKWGRARKRKRTEIEGARAQERIGEMRERLEALDDKALAAADIGLELIGLRLREVASAFEYRKTLRDRHTFRHTEGDVQVILDDAELPYIDVRELEVLARAASAWHTLGERAAGAGPQTRIEVTGAGGMPLDTGVREELERDDPDRLGAVIDVLARADVLALARGDDRGDDREDVAESA